MNKEFIKKMVKAEILRYGALKEILPDGARRRVEAFERNTSNLIKEIAIEIIKEDITEERSEDKKTSKKVNVDFS